MPSGGVGQPPSEPRSEDPGRVRRTGQAWQGPRYRTLPSESLLPPRTRVTSQARAQLPVFLPLQRSAASPPPLSGSGQYPKDEVVPRFQVSHPSSQSRRDRGAGGRHGPGFWSLHQEAHRPSSSRRLGCVLRSGPGLWVANGRKWGRKRHFLGVTGRLGFQEQSPGFAEAGRQLPGPVVSGPLCVHVYVHVRVCAGWEGLLDPPMFSVPQASVEPVVVGRSHE